MVVGLAVLQPHMQQHFVLVLGLGLGLGPELVLVPVLEPNIVVMVMVMFVVIDHLVDQHLFVNQDFGIERVAVNKIQ